MRVVTIDGPAGAGKSTVARRVAEELGWRFLDTGAMYRSVALAGLRRGIALEDQEALGALTESLSVLMPPGGVLLDGVDVSEAIRQPAVTAATRHAADNPKVRQILIGWQRAFAADFDTVTEGRDQGTIVFPDALLKIFLTASLEERARRRQAELTLRGTSAPVTTIQDELRRRDLEDETRAIAPLRAADDALQIDTTGIDLEDVVTRVRHVLQEVLRG